MNYLPISAVAFEHNGLFSHQSYRNHQRSRNVSETVRDFAVHIICYDTCSIINPLLYLCETQIAHFDSHNFVF